MHKALSLVVILAVAAAAQADTVTLNVGAGLLYQDDGATPLPADSTLVILADADEDGFGDFTTPGAWSDDPGDVVAAHFGLNEAVGAGTALVGLSGISLDDTDPDGLNTGDPLMLLWYDTPFDASDTGAGENVDFNTFRTDDTIDGSTTGWEVPSGGAVIALNFLTVAVGGSNPESAGVADQTTVPEPATMLLLALGGGAAIVRRRRSA
jgi:hypothetical protein